MAGGLTINNMLRGGANNGTAGIPTTTFYASNIAGTTVPRVGSAQGATGVSNAGAMAGVNPMHIAMIIVVIIGIGYLAHHLAFEESLKI